MIGRSPCDPTVRQTADPSLPRTGLDHLVTLVDQAETERGTDTGVVLDEQQAVGHPTILLPPAVRRQLDRQRPDVVAALEHGQLAPRVAVAPGAADDRQVLVRRVGDQALEGDLPSGQADRADAVGLEVAAGEQRGDRAGAALDAVLPSVAGDPVWDDAAVP